MSHVVYVTHPVAGAAEFAQVLVERRVAACVNVLPAAQSIYRWEGKVESSTESLLIIKTDESRLDELEEAVRELHPYDIPEFIAVRADKISHAYYGWLQSAVSR